MSPSPPRRGGEGRGEEAFSWALSMLTSPPAPLPLRCRGRGENGNFDARFLDGMACRAEVAQHRRERGKTRWFQAGSVPPSLTLTPSLSIIANAP